MNHNELVEAYQSDATREREKVIKFVSKKCDLDKQYNCGAEAVDNRPFSLIRTAVSIVSEVIIKVFSSELEMRSDEDHMNLQKSDSLGFNQKISNESCRSETCKSYDEFVLSHCSFRMTLLRVLMEAFMILVHWFPNPFHLIFCIYFIGQVGIQMDYVRKLI